MSFSSTKLDKAGELVWLKLRSSQVFWPACIYDGYSPAISNSHDPSALKAMRRELMPDERVVYFFGVGPCGCLVRSAPGLTPTLQLCVARLDDMTCVPYTDEPTEFAALCREHLISDDIVDRAENNTCFRRAKDEALAYKYSVTDAATASAYFLTLLETTKRVAQSSTRSPERSSQDTGAKAQKTNAAASPSRATTTTTTTTAAQSLPPPPQFYSPPHVKLSRALLSSPSPSKKVLVGLEHALTTFWKHMLDSGWETLTQSNGVMLYKKPGVSFFDLRPNENVFDALVKAFNAFVRDWLPTLTDTAATTDAKVDAANAELVDALWLLAEKSGWTTITAANETWYIMPDTPFNACVPNVTIFQSKREVIAKFLVAAGIIEPSVTEADEADETETLAMDVDDDEAEDVEVDGGDADEDGEANEDGEADEDDEAAEEDSDEAMSESGADDDDESVTEVDDEKEVEVVAPVKPAPKARVRAKKQPKTVAAAAPPATKPQQQPKTKPSSVPTTAASSAAKKLTFETKPPPFKCTFGKIEVELQARGWFWKNGKLDWTYYKPHCAGFVEDNKPGLTAGVDYFDGRFALEEYLKVSGEIDEIRDALERAHAAAYAVETTSDSSDEDAKAAGRTTAPRVVATKKPVASKSVANKSVANKSVANKSVANKSVANKSVAKQSVERRPTTNSTVATDAVVTKSTARRPTNNSVKTDAADKENRSANIVVRPTTKQRQSASSASVRSSTRTKRSYSRHASSSTTNDTATVKFGAIWAVLAQQGWHYKEGKFEYDYFRPTCRDTCDGVAGVDYFVSKSMLIDYLQTSGIWRKVAKQVAHEAAMDLVTSSDDDVSDSVDKTQTSVAMAESPVAIRQALKRRSSGLAERKSPGVTTNNKTPTTSQRASKKARVSGTFRTPPEQLRRTGGADAATDESDGDIMDVADNKISPDASTTTTSTTTTTTNSSNLPRKLADCFTPSPGPSKKDKSRVVATGPLARYQDAIQRLSLGYAVPQLTHRDAEAERIATFFTTCFTNRCGASMYISGAPGCGKTALLKASESRITELYQETHGVADTKQLVQCHVNAMVLTDANKLFCDLATALTGQSFDDGARAFEAIERATNTATKRCKTMVLVLDEIDVLLKKNGIERELCRLFELAHRDAHTFVLVGIANQVDFTERHLPLLTQQLPTCTPDVLIFEPYSHTAIEQILITRLGGKGAALELLNTHGISFLARKIASTSGDVRLALDICRRVLQHRVDQASSQNLRSDSESELDTTILHTPVPLTDMLRLVKASLETKSAQTIQSLPRTLQLILFATLRLDSSLSMSMASVHAEPASSVVSDPTTALYGIQELYTCYIDASRDAGVYKAQPFREFKRSLETLASEGLLGAAQLKKELVKLQFLPSELLTTFRNDAYFARLV